MSVLPFPDPKGSKDSSARDVSDSWFDDDPEGGGSGKMSFLEHLDEFRKRIIRALLSLAVGVAIAAYYIEDIYKFVMLPLRQMLRPGETMIYTYPTEAFMLYIRIALIAGLLIAAPLVFWQVWLFVAPALYAKERRYAIPFVMLSSIGFIGGAAFSHYVAFPLMWRFFASFSSELVSFMPRIEDASACTCDAARDGAGLSDAGLVFFLARMGWSRPGGCSANSSTPCWGSSIVAAVITPGSDVASQMIVAVPMVILYLLSIVIAWVVRQEEEDGRGTLDRHPVCALQRPPVTTSSGFIFTTSFVRRSRSSTTPSFRPFGAHGHAQRHADQVGILELDARASSSRSSSSTSRPARFQIRSICSATSPAISVFAGSC